ncbi:hypothetical protein A2U01_0091128, partial [Trifolium medium]|nr:hypothetical protein [Trifolium medium]
DSRAKASYYKAVNEKKGKDFGRGKPYSRGGKKPDEGGPSGGRGGGARGCTICGVPVTVSSSARRKTEDVSSVGILITRRIS